MQLAYYDNIEKRVRPTYSGQIGTCPLCGGAVIGKCGEIYVRHWQHRHDTNCDLWSEHETPWHCEWKEKFPEDMQEVVIENYGEKHRADIKTYSGTVIEFQHSSISKATIRIREEFYEDMVWVIDAQPFKDNLRKRSVVQARLKDIDNSSIQQVSSIEQEHSDELKRLTNIIKENENSINDRNRSIESYKEKLDKLNDDIFNIDELSKTIVDKWESKERFWESHSADITNDLECEYSSKLKEIPTKLTSLNTEMQQFQKTIDEINALENFVVEERVFKIIPYSNITNQNFQKTRAISKESQKTLFVEVNKMTSESEFQHYRYKQDKFDFAIDPTDAFSNLKIKIKMAEQQSIEIQSSIPKLKEEIKSKLFERIQAKVSKLETAQKQLEDGRTIK